MRHEHVREDPRFRLPSSQMAPQQKYGYDGDGSAQHMINISHRIRLDAACFQGCKYKYVPRIESASCVYYVQPDMLVLAGPIM
jgi:hypothetical protein